MKKIVFTLWLLFFSLGVSAQIDYLEPVGSLSTYKGELGEYYKKVFELLNTGFQVKPHARVVVIPSFSPEYAMSVEKRNGHCYLLANTLSRSYWQADRRSVQMETKSVQISPTLYRTLGEVFRIVTEQIQDMDGSGAGLDGVVYYFYATNAKGQVMKGRKWSPAHGVLMKHLLQVCQSAYLLSQGQNISEATLAGESVALLKKLQQRSKEQPHAYKKPVYAGFYRVGPAPIPIKGGKIYEFARFRPMEVDDFVARQLIYPASLQSKQVSGYALCDFVISKEGKVLRPVILKATEPEFGAEALRIVRKMPDWLPAFVDGKPVESSYTIYVPFRPKK